MDSFADMKVLRDSGARCGRIPKNYAMILTLLFFMMLSTTNSFPIEFPASTTEEDSSENITTERYPTPLEIGSFDVSTQQNTHYDPTAHTSVEIAYPSSSSPIRSNSPNRGPAIANSVINLIERQIKEHPVEEIIVSLSDFHQTHSNLLQDQDVNHSKRVSRIIDEELLRVLPLHAPVPKYQLNLLTQDPPRNDRMYKEKETNRIPIGGFGNGLNHGGHGSGHGYHVHTFFN